MSQPEPTLQAARPASPDDYHSTCEPSGFKFESDQIEESDDNSTGYSTTSSMCDTDNTQWSNTKNHDRKCQNQKNQDCHEHCKTNAKKQWNQRSSKVILPLFRELTKENAVTYADIWLHCRVYPDIVLPLQAAKSVKRDRV